MLERVDIDEKWFYMTEVATSYILVPGETPPHQTCKHKSHIEKVMCLTAVARPRQSPMNGEWWDGKTGNWFFVEQVPAKRTSKNRPVGTLETKSFKVGKKESIEMYLDNLLPGIILKWPEWWPKKVRIQLDNAPSHTIAGKYPFRCNTQYYNSVWAVN
jgi:hypothetical protein